MGLLGQSVLVSCIPECHSMPRFVIQRQSYGLGFGAFADAGKLDTLGGASSILERRAWQRFVLQMSDIFSILYKGVQNHVRIGSMFDLFHTDPARIRHFLQ